MTADARASTPGGVPTVLRALRIVNGEPRLYEPTWCGARFVDQTVRQARATGLALPVEECPDDYALIDVLDDDGSIVGEWAVPDARAFRWWYRRLGLRVVRDGAYERDRSAS